MQACVMFNGIDNIVLYRLIDLMAQSHNDLA